jgi:hypothetical protein
MGLVPKSRGRIEFGAEAQREIPSLNPDLLGSRSLDEGKRLLDLGHGPHVALIKHPVPVKNGGANRVSVAGRAATNPPAQTVVRDAYFISSAVCAHEDVPFRLYRSLHFTARVVKTGPANTTATGNHASGFSDGLGRKKINQGGSISMTDDLRIPPKSGGIAPDMVNADPQWAPPHTRACLCNLCVRRAESALRQQIAHEFKRAA